MSPFPHVVLDGFLPAPLLAELASSWPAPVWPGWMPPDARQPGKKVSDLLSRLPDAVGEALRLVATSGVAEALGLEDVLWDLGCWGAGLHECTPGGPGLAPHLDGEAHGRLGLVRLVSAVLYVHDAWESTWGGELLLHPGRGESPAVLVSPLPGRLAAFATAGAWHSVAPVRGPAPRRSLALFGYGSRARGDRRRRALFVLSG